MKVEVVFADARGATRVPVVLADAATVADAVAASGLVTTLRLDVAALAFAVFGRRARADASLVDGDRVELLRPLVVDPKEARRRRVAKRDGR